MIDLLIKQGWLEKSSDTALEEFKSALADTLNSFVEDRHTDQRWHITKATEGEVAHLVYDERSIAVFQKEDSSLKIFSDLQALPRYDDIMYAIRSVADRLLLTIFSNQHGGAQLPQDPSLSFCHSLFTRDRQLSNFFANSNFKPLYAQEGIRTLEDGRKLSVIFAPYYAQANDGSIHILNDSMLAFLKNKDNQQVNEEFSYKVSDTLNDFARKYNLGLIPKSFYQNYNFSTKIINETYFDERHIDRKVFIDPYVWDFDDQHNVRYYDNTENGIHLMDKVRKGEDLDSALKRILREELRISEDYVGARIWGLEFDRDKEGSLTPRLKINVFLHGLSAKKSSQTHDWVSL